jgi:capsular exopolysaccharide synthesis family protein
MELRQIAGTLWKWAWLIILAAAAAAASSWWAVRDQPPIYQTSSTLMVGQTIQEVSPDYSEFYTAQQLAQTYSELIRREPVLKATAAALGFEEQWRSLQAQVSAALVAGTQLMEVRVVDTDPVRAKRLADEVARQLIATVAATRPQGSSRQFIQEQVDSLPPKIEAAQEQISELEAELGQTFSAREIQDLQSQINTLESQVNDWRSTFAQYQLLLGDTGVNVLTVVEEAPLPTHPMTSRKMMQVALAAAVGMMLAVGAGFLIEYLDDTVKTPQDVERKTKLSTLGSIIRFPRGNGEGPLAAVKPKSAIAEGYRVLRTNVQFAAMGLGKSAVVLLVTSAQPTEGKTTTLANLGVSLAQAGRRVLLVDTDLRRPALHRLFNLPKEAGLTSLLLEPEADVEHVVQKTATDGLRVLPSGPVPANPAEVLGFAEMTTLLERLRTMADYVLLDSPPVLTVADTSVLAQKVDGVLMVVEAGRTRTQMFERAVAVLQGVKARVLGAVLAKVGVSRSGQSYDYYYYYSDYYADEEGGAPRKKRHRRENRLQEVIGGLFHRRRQAHAPGGAVPSASVQGGTDAAEAPSKAEEAVSGVPPAATAEPEEPAKAEEAGAEVPPSAAAAEVEPAPEAEEVAAERSADAGAAVVEAQPEAAKAASEVPLAPMAPQAETLTEAEEAVPEVPAAPALEAKAQPDAGELVSEVPARSVALEVEPLPEAREAVAEISVGVAALEGEALAKGEQAGAEEPLAAVAPQVESLPGASEALAEVSAGSATPAAEALAQAEEVVAEVPAGAGAQQVEPLPEARAAVAQVSAVTVVLATEALPQAEEAVAGVPAGAEAPEVEPLAEAAEAIAEALPQAEEVTTAAQPGASVSEVELPSEADAVYAEAMEHYRNGEWAEARSGLLRLRALDPARPDLDALLKDVAQVMKHDRPRQRAKKRPSGAVGRRPRVRLGRLVVLAILLLSATGAILIYAGILPMPSLSLPLLDNRVQTQINRGYDFFIVDNYEEAIRSFNKALELDPDNAEAKLGLQHATQYLELRDLYGQARALMEQKSFDAAIAVLQTILQTDPWYKEADLLLLQSERSQQLEVLYEQAMGYYNAGDWAKATEAFESLQGQGVAEGETEIKSRLFDCYLNEGTQQIAAADSRAAIIRATVSFNSALALSPNDLVAQEERQLASLYLDGYTAYEGADWRQVITNLSRIYAVRPDYAQGQAARLLCASYTKLGDSYEASGQLQLALEQYHLVQSVTECDQTEISGKIERVAALLGPVAPSPTAKP